VVWLETNIVCRAKFRSTQQLAAAGDLYFVASKVTITVQQLSATKWLFQEVSAILMRKTQLV
jgi:hypothetical protein